LSLGLVTVRPGDVVDTAGTESVAPSTGVDDVGNVVPPTEVELPTGDVATGTVVAVVESDGSPSEGESSEHEMRASATAPHRTNAMGRDTSGTLGAPLHRVSTAVDVSGSARVAT
jgi:hypothetical protein